MPKAISQIHWPLRSFKKNRQRNIQAGTTTSSHLGKTIREGRLDKTATIERPAELLKIEEQPSYKIKAILQSRQHQGIIQYLTEWEEFRQM